MSAELELKHAQALITRLRRDLDFQEKRAMSAERRLNAALDALCPHPVYRKHFDWESAEQCVSRAARFLADPDA